jgi:hypothetical protein
MFNPRERLLRHRAWTVEAGIDDRRAKNQKPSPILITAVFKFDFLNPGYKIISG